jgi:hypothetical protein
MLRLLAVSPSSARITDFEGTGSDRRAQATFVPVYKKKFFRSETTVKKKQIWKMKTKKRYLIVEVGQLCLPPIANRLQYLSICQT